jgi:hypothetical protein
MDVGGGVVPTPSPLSEFDAFRKLVAEASKRPLSAAQQKFVKKLECIPSVELPLEETCRMTVNLADRGLIGQFTRALALSQIRRSLGVEELEPAHLRRNKESFCRERILCIHLRKP